MAKVGRPKLFAEELKFAVREDQAADLRRLADTRGISMSELIRDALDRRIRQLDRRREPAQA